MERICNTTFLSTLIKKVTQNSKYMVTNHKTFFLKFETLFVLIDKGILLKNSLSIRGSDKHSIG